MDQSTDVIELISSLLESGKYKEALSIPNEEKYINSFKDNCTDLISVIIGKVQDDTITIKPSLHGVCEELLLIIIQKSAPEEALLEFIEQIELAKNDAQLSLLLTPLQQLLKKLTTKRGRSLEWCLNSIAAYIEKIPTSEYDLEGRERLVLDCVNNIRRVQRVYSLLPPFYSPFIKELSTADVNVRTKEIIAAFLISLMGKPLIYIDLDPEYNINSQAKQVTCTLIQDICVLVKDVFKFLSYIEICNSESKKTMNRNYQSDSEEDIKPYDNREKVNLSTLSGLFYVVCSGHFEIPETAIPVVYSTEYTIHTTLICVTHLLGYTEYGPLAKAISLCRKLLNNFPGNQSSVLLSVPIHFELCKSLIKVAIFPNYESIRKSAVHLINCHVNKFEYKGRCMVIKYMLDIANHSGMIGYTITLYKNSIDEAFKDNSNMPECFTATHLMSFLKKICYLPRGAESDLVELADQIITSLNFLRYLTLRDTDNLTGIKDCFATLINDYLEMLRVALNMSIAHYEAKLMEIEDAKNLPKEEVKITVNMRGTILDNIPTKNKIEILQSSLNAFHLIQALRNGRRFLKPLTIVPINNAQRIIRHYCQYVQDDLRSKDVPMKSVGTEHDEHQYEEDVKNRILAKALEFVPKTGWSIESLTQGAEASGYPGVTHGLFPNGGGDLVHYFNIKCNEELVQEMKTWPKEDLKESKIPAQKIDNAIMTRLLMIQPYKSTWPKAIAIQTLPSNVPNCLATLLSLVDDICYHTGDRSVDFNWYIRRVGLAGIYKASELFYLTDNSQNNSATRGFVKSRIRDAELIQTALNMNPVTVAPQTLTAAFVTAKNMLGINTLK